MSANKITEEATLDALYYANRMAAREYDEAWAEAEAARLRMVEKRDALIAAHTAFVEANNAAFISYLFYCFRLYKFSAFKFWNWKFRDFRCKRLNFRYFRYIFRS